MNLFQERLAEAQVCPVHVCDEWVQVHVYVCV